MQAITNLDRLPGNILFLNKNGEAIFKGNHRKASFYVKKGLGEWVTQNPPVVQLNFETKGDGNKGSEYYLSEKYPRCIVSGESRNLHKVSIVPAFIRKHFNKTHSSFDVQLMCEKEMVLFNKSQQNLIKYKGLIRDEGLSKSDLSKITAAKKLHALEKYSDKIPKFKRKNYEKYLSTFFKKDYSDLTIKDIRDFKEEVSEIKPKVTYRLEGLSYQKLAQDFRQLLLSTRQPKFLPEGWSVSFEG